MSQLKWNHGNCFFILWCCLLCHTSDIEMCALVIQVMFIYVYVSVYLCFCVWYIYYTYTCTGINRQCHVFPTTVFLCKDVYVQGLIDITPNSPKTLNLAICISNKEYFTKKTAEKWFQKHKYRKCDMNVKAVFSSLCWIAFYSYTWSKWLNAGTVTGIFVRPTHYYSN